MSRLPTLLDPDPSAPFPPAGRALRDPDGLLALGGDLSPQRLLNAYRHGIFPWYSSGQPILWWSPDPRMVFDVGSFRLPSRFVRSLRKSTWTLRADTRFRDVIHACAHAPRGGQGNGTWILPEMLEAYCELHRLGHAHSIEVFDGARLVGGLYGIAVGRMFCGESMFSAEPGGSKVALGGLVGLLRGWEWPLIDAQLENAHLVRLGGKLLARSEFLNRLEQLQALDGNPGPWTAAFGNRAANEFS